MQTDPILSLTSPVPVRNRNSPKSLGANLFCAALACLLIIFSTFSTFSTHAAAADKTAIPAEAGAIAQAGEMKPGALPGVIIIGLVFFGLAGYRESRRLNQLRQRVTSS